MPTVDGIYVPKGLEQIEHLARMNSHMRRRSEKEEIRRLRKQTWPLVRDGITEGVYHAGTLDHFVALHEAGKITISLGDGSQFSTPLWGRVDLNMPRSLREYRGNIGLALLGRDTAILTGNIFGLGNLSRGDLHWSHMTLDWRRILYLAQLSRDDEFVNQFRDDRGLALFSSRYFKGNRTYARDAALHIIERSKAALLKWPNMWRSFTGKPIYSTPYVQYALSRPQAEAAHRTPAIARSFASSTLRYSAARYMIHGIPAR